MKILSPVFFKEMVTLARRRRHYATRALFLGLLLLVTWMAWAETAGRRAYQSFSDLSYVGRNLFEAFSIVQVFLVAFLVPALTAPVIAAERDRNTLNLLLMTNLRHPNILLDKLLSRFALVFLLLLATLPLFLALLKFGGITPSDISILYQCLLGIMLFCGGVGLLFSTLTRKMYIAVILTYGFLVLYTIGVIALEDFLRYDDPLAIIFPVAAFDADEGILRLGRIPISLFLCYSLLVFLVCLFASIRLLPRLAGRERRPVIKRFFTWLDAFYRRINFTGVVVSDPSRAKWTDSVRAQEATKSLFARNTFRVRAFYLLLILSFFVPVLGGFDLAYATRAIVLVSLLISAILALTLGAVLFTSEREKHSLEMLLSTPILGRELVMGKFLLILRILSPILANALLWWIVHVLVSIIGGSYMPSGHNSYFRVPVAWPGVLLAPIAATVAQLPLLAVIGLWASAERRRTSTALLQAFSIVLGLTILSFFGYVMSFGLFSNGPGLGWGLFAAIVIFLVVAVVRALRGPGARITRSLRILLPGMALLFGMGLLPIRREPPVFLFIYENLTPASLVTALLEACDFSWLAAGLTTLFWIVLLRALCRNFDRLAGRP